MEGRKTGYMSSGAVKESRGLVGGWIVGLGAVWKGRRTME